MKEETVPIKEFKEAVEAFQSLPLEEREKLCTILQAFTLGYKMGKVAQEDDPDSLLLKIKQKDLVKTWTYDGHYRYQIEIVSDMPPDDIPWY